MNKYKMPLAVYYTGYEACASGHSFGPAVRPHYLLHFVLSGKGTYRLKGKSYKLKEHMGFLIKPEDVSYYEADREEPWTYAWVAFDGDRVDEFLDMFKWQQGDRICDFEDGERLKTYVQDFLISADQGHEGNIEMLGYLYLIFGLLEKDYRPAASANDRSYIDQALYYVRHNYSYLIKVSDICRHVGIERSYLYKLFMKYLEMSPKDYLTDYRVQIAKDLLNNTNLKTTEIASSCGFTDSSVFCKSFKRLEGVTPQGYRRNKAF